MKTIILHSKNQQIAEEIAKKYRAKWTTYPSHSRIYVAEKIALDDLRELYQCDFNYLPDDFDAEQIRLFITDMDSTLISIESINELADFANLKLEAAKITEQAMLGQMNFVEALQKRVKLLKGLPLEVLDKVYTEKLQISPGGEKLLDFLQKRAVKTALASGGFTYFSEKLAKQLKLDDNRANTLKIADGKLSGEVVGEIIGADAKGDFVLELCDKYGISSQQVIAVGDGANDLKMLGMAGLSVAFRAKPIVQNATNVAINFGGLDKIIDFFG